MEEGKFGVENGSVERRRLKTAKLIEEPTHVPKELSRVKGFTPASSGLSNSTTICICIRNTEYVEYRIQGSTYFTCGETQGQVPPNSVSLSIPAPPKGIALHGSPTARRRRYETLGTLGTAVASRVGPWQSGWGRHIEDECQPTADTQQGLLS